MKKVIKVKFIAELTKWDGEVITQEIRREWAQDIASAIEGQYFFASNKDGFSVRGGDFRHVDIYEVSA